MAAWLHALTIAGGWRPLSGGAEARLMPQPRLSGPMPWVIAIMVALTVVAAAAGLSLRNTANAVTAELAGGVTIQVVEPAAEAREAQSRAALARLGGLPGVTAARLASATEVEALIEPWLGADASDAESIPVPALIDVRLDGAASPQRLADLRAALATVAPSARVDAQSDWLRPVFDAIQSLQLLSLALVALLAFRRWGQTAIRSRSSTCSGAPTVKSRASFSARSASTPRPAGFWALRSGWSRCCFSAAASPRSERGWWIAARWAGRAGPCWRWCPSRRCCWPC
jgi:cell division transport system permease protein